MVAQPLIKSLQSITVWVDPNGFEAMGRGEALAIMCELVGACYGEDGLAVGAKVREANGPYTLSWLLEDESVDAR